MRTLVLVAYFQIKSSPPVAYKLQRNVIVFGSVPPNTYELRVDRKKKKTSHLPGFRSDNVSFYSKVVFQLSHYPSM